jgi:hypothetical protein
MNNDFFMCVCEQVYISFARLKHWFQWIFNRQSISYEGEKWFFERLPNEIIANEQKNEF